MVLGPGARDHDSPNQLFLILKAPRYATKTKKTQQFQTQHFGTYENLELETVESVRSHIWEKIEFKSLRF